MCQKIVNQIGRISESEARADKEEQFPFSVSLMDKNAILVGCGI